MTAFARIINVKVTTIFLIYASNFSIFNNPMLWSNIHLVVMICCRNDFLRQIAVIHVSNVSILGGWSCEITSKFKSKNCFQFHIITDFGIFKVSWNLKQELWTFTTVVIDIMGSFQFQWILCAYSSILLFFSSSRLTRYEQPICLAWCTKSWERNAWCITIHDMLHLP